MANLLPSTLAFTGRHAAPAVVLATALTATALSYVSARTVVEAQVSRRFQDLGIQTTDAVGQRMDAYLLMLRTAAGMISALGRAPTAAEFRAFHAALDPDHRFPGIQGIGWAEVLHPDEVAPHELAVRATGRTGYRVWPPGQRDAFSSIVLLEPLDWRNERALGYDMYSEPARRQAMARARDTGAPAASGKVELVQEAGDSRQAGFLVYVPVYAGRTAPTTVEARRERLIGWVFAPFRAGDLLRSTLALADVPGVRLAVHDGSEAVPEALLTAIGPAGTVPQRVRVTRVEVNGRTWTLRLTADDRFLHAAERQLPRIVAAVATAVALLLFWITLRETQARARAERVAARSAFLADAGRLLAASFDYFRTLDDVARLAAGQVADAAVIYLDEPGEPVWIAGHRDPDVAARTSAALRGWRPQVDGAVGVAAALQAGAPQLVRRLAFDEPPLSRSPELAALLRGAGVRAALTVPMVARGEPLGAVMLLSSRRFGAFRPDTVALAEDLARLIVAAVESARLFRRAQEAVRSRDEFLSIASHELKTPITSLALQADSLRTSASRGDVESFGRKVEVIRRNVRRLSGLVSSLLDLSRIQAGRLELEPEEVDLVEIAREVVSRFEEEAQRAHSPLGLQADGPVVGHWDRTRLDQVIANLVSNALKYGRGKPVDVSVEARDERALLTVRDGGIGIAEADQPRIFERFERAVSDRHYGGFGLGLWIVREVVVAMGGTIRVESAPREGSTFTVELRRTSPPGTGRHGREPAPRENPSEQ